MMTWNLLYLYLICSWISHKALQNDLIICDELQDSIVCNNGTLTILDASYGRHDNMTCPGIAMTITNCHAPNSFSYVNDTCGGKATCTVFAHYTNVEVDPCYGTFKYFLIEYNCTDPLNGTTGHRITICGGEYHEITCDIGVILVTYASFGRHDNFTCPFWKMTSTYCHANNSLSVVKQICGKNSTCKLTADAKQFSPDDCDYRIYRYLTVQYTCDQKENKATGNYNTELFNYKPTVSNEQEIGVLMTSKKAESLIACLSRDCFSDDCRSAIFDPLDGICHTFTGPGENQSLYQLTGNENIWTKD